MKKLLSIIGATLALSGAFLSCTDDNDNSIEDKYRDWYKVNDAWLKEQQARKNPDGTPYYKVVTPSWNPGAFVLIHFFNNPAENEGNLAPIYTSTIDVRYNGYYYNDIGFDSSIVSTTPAPGVVRFRLNQVVSGWAMAVSQMHCGDTAEIILPYGTAYGTSGNGVIPPYSNLRFNIRLVDVPYYEAPPYK